MSKPQGGRSRVKGCLGGLGCFVFILMLMVWAIYTYVYGFGGMFTIYYLPTPDQLVSDSIAPPGDILSTIRRNRVYEVQQTVKEVVIFYQQALPRTGWTIRAQGAFISSNGNPAYCFQVEQRGVQADIWMAEIKMNIMTRVVIHFDDPSLCDNSLRHSRQP